MPLLETKGAASAQGFGLTLSSAATVYIEDVFSTYLYRGDGTSSRSIGNQINLADNGGLVWLKGRNESLGPYLFDTARGPDQRLASSATGGSAGVSFELTSFNTTGFTVGSAIATNGSGRNFVTWTFRKAPKFFDVVTFSQSGGFKTTNHSLGESPGLIIVKRTDAADEWWTWHVSTSPNNLQLNRTTGAQANGIFGTITSTTFQTVGLTGSFVAYLFAHDTTTGGVVQCGSYTGNGSATGPIVTLGWEPQWLLIKNASGTGNWQIIDNMRGMPVGSADATLQANLTNTESSADYVSPTATGFQIVSTSSEVNTSSSTYIYVAIRRGPMRTPTSGTSVFAPRAQTGEAAFNNSFPVDLVIERDRTSSALGYTSDRLRGGAYALDTTSNAAEFSAGPAFFDSDNGTFRAIFVGGASSSVVYENFGRAPGFMDVVCYPGNGAANRSINHNLGVAPELVLIKGRNASTSNADSNWSVNTSSTIASAAGRPSSNYLLFLNSNGGWYNWGANWFGAAGLTATTFPVTEGLYGATCNGSGTNYVAYLFASCPGVSKVGTYTGNGSSQTINCGFASGARFVMIKRTDNSGNWYFWDSARGISAAGVNDPYLLMNSVSAEVTTDDSLSAQASGFGVIQNATTNINVNTATYIFLAIA